MILINRDPLSLNDKTTKKLVPGFGFCVVTFDELPAHRTSLLRPEDSHVK